MANIELKIQALRLLVENQILTEEEFLRCKKAVSEDSNEYEIEVVNGPVSGKVYDDSRMRIEFKNIDRVNNLFYGPGYRFSFSLSNNTNMDFRVHLREVTINGFTVGNDERLCECVVAHKKAIGEIYLFDKKLNQCDVYEQRDIEEMEFKVQYFQQDEHYHRTNEYTSEMVSINVI